MRSPGRNAPDRIWSRSASCAFTVCETERSTSRSAMPLLRGLEMLRRVFLRHHLVDQLARPHRAGVDVEIVEDAIGILVHRALLRFEDQLVLVEDAGDTVADLGGDALLAELVVAHEGPEIVAGLLGLGRDGVEHKAVDALRAIAFRRAGAGRRDADVDGNGAWRLEADDLPAIDETGLAKLLGPERRRLDAAHPARHRHRLLAMGDVERRLGNCDIS